MEHLHIQAIINNKIVYEKVINFISKDTSFLYDNIIYKNQDYWRCFYNNEIFNVPIDKMPSNIITCNEVPYIVLEEITRNDFKKH